MLLIHATTAKRISYRQFFPKKGMVPAGTGNSSPRGDAAGVRKLSNKGNENEDQVYICINCYCNGKGCMLGSNHLLTKFYQ